MASQGIAHKNLTDPQLHEMKGASAAQAGQVPFADGEGHTNWENITLDKLDIEPRETTQGTPNSSTAPVTLDTLGMSAITNNTCTDAANFTQANKNTKEVAVKVNALITYATALQASYNNLVTKFNALQTALKELGLISTGE